MKKLLAILLAVALCCSAALAEGVQIIAMGNGEMSGEYQELKPGESIKKDGDYKIAFVEAEIMTLEYQSRDGGWWWGYLKTTESGTDTSLYSDYPIGTHTPLFFRCSFTNYSMETVSLLKRIQCSVVFDDKYIFDKNATWQYNPDQVNSDGKKRPSVIGVDIEPLIRTDFVCIINIPWAVFESDKPLVAYVSIDDDVYAINIRDNLIISNE